MNIIKGLLIKDLLQLKTYKRNFIITIFIYAIIIVSNSNNVDMGSMGAVMIMFLFSIYAMATLGYDEKSKADRYILTLPLTKKEVVRTKYILIILSLILGATIGLVLGGILSYAVLKIIPNIKEILFTLLCSTFIISIAHCIQIPCIYKYGYEKGRLQIYIIMFVVCMLCGGAYTVFPNIDLSFLDKIEAFIPLILVALIVFNYFISYKISYKIYSKKEI